MAAIAAVTDAKAKLLYDTIDVARLPRKRACTASAKDLTLVPWLPPVALRIASVSTRQVCGWS